MIYSDGNSGWGEEYASKPIRDLMSAHPEDVRWSYIFPLKDGSGNMQQKNGIDIYYITKFSFQGGSPSLSSPVMFRLAEMYLNKAEAEAKNGMTSAALDDIDIIRNNRGLQNSLYNGVLPTGNTVLMVVLNERRMELAFEGQRWFDLVRIDHGQYGLDFLHSIGKTNATTKNLLLPIPQAERDANPNLTQNPGY